MRLSLCIAAVLLFLSTIFSGLVMAIEEPQYEVLAKEGDFELREYAPMIVAYAFCDA